MPTCDSAAVRKKIGKQKNEIKVNTTVEQGSVEMNLFFDLIIYLCIKLKNIKCLCITSENRR